MARIRIEDLPPVENLTPEELEEILGAGRQSFRPAFEAMEGREMMDAGLGGAVLPSLLAAPHAAAPTAALYREFNPTASTPAMGVDMENMYSALARGARPQGQAAPSDIGTISAAFQSMANQDQGRAAATAVGEYDVNTAGNKLYQKLLIEARQWGALEDLNMHDGFEKKADGGLRMWVKVLENAPDGSLRVKERLEFNFEFQGRNGDKGTFKLQDVTKWVQTTGGQWRPSEVGFPEKLANHLKNMTFIVYC
jgi:hypothetical protein